MKTKQKLDYLIGLRYRFPVYEGSVEFSGVKVDSMPPSKSKIIELNDVLIACKVHMDTQDEHIKALLNVFNHLKDIGLYTKLMEDYERSKNNKLYEYAMFKPWRECEIFN